MFEIIITSVSTLVVTVIGGLLISFISQRKKKLYYTINMSSPMKIKKEDDTYVGINIIKLFTRGKITAENSTLIIKTAVASFKRHEIDSKNACKYIVTSESEKEIELSIPLFKTRDVLNVSLVTEQYTGLAPSCEVFLRNSKNIQLIDDGKRKDTTNNRYFVILLVGIISAFSVLTVQSILSPTNIPIINGVTQKDNLVFLSSIANLPKLTEYYNSQSDIKYFNQGDYIFSICVQNSNDTELLKKYVQFLLNTIAIAGNMTNQSKAALLYNAAKIYKITNDSSSTIKYLKMSQEIDKELITQRLKYDLAFAEYLKQNGYQ